ncbi:hypothetical protein JCM19992_01220 [Thermostilla marina]
MTHERPQTTPLCTGDDAPLVSVVVPVFNGSPFLRKALESVLEQTYRPIEIVVVDDGSQDDSAAIAASYGPPVRVIRQPNYGVGAARNRAILHARGEIVAFLDQDDWWLPAKLEKQVACFRDPQVGLVHTGTLHYLQPAEKFVDPIDPSAQPELLIGECYDRLLAGNAICNSSVAVRRDLFARVGLTSPLVRGNTVQDYDLWLRFARVCRFAYVDEPLTVFRIHGEQGTFDRRAMLTEQLRLLERVLREEPKRRRRQMRDRMAYLYDLLGTFHLDYREHRLARRRFARALRWRFRARTAILWTLAWLPPRVLNGIRHVRRRFKQPQEDPFTLSPHFADPSDSHTVSKTGITGAHADTPQETA